MKKTLAVLLAIPVLLLVLSLSFKGLATKKAEEKYNWLMENLLPGGDSFEKVEYAEENTPIRAVHKCEKGYVIETSVEGYVNEIVMLVGVDYDGKVTGLVTYKANETLGIGSRILYDKAFLAQFLNQTGSFTVGAPDDADWGSGATGDSTESTGDAVYIDGISGATVSSKAVAKSVNAAVAYVTGADVGSSATEW